MPNMEHNFQILCNRIDELHNGCIVTIDGCSAAGKSTLAALLKQTYSCNVIPMDDFFLRPSQKTPERLEEAGGNIDYERFSEIIDALKSGAAFTYRPYNCREEKLSDPITILPNPVTVIEGVYSMHPLFSDAYDVTAFLRIDESEQLRRLANRNQQLFDRFVHEWLPMERKYFDTFRIADKCDFVLS